MSVRPTKKEMAIEVAKNTMHGNPWEPSKQRVTIKRKKTMARLDSEEEGVHHHPRKKDAATAAVHARLEKEPWNEPSKNVTIKVKRGNRRRRAPTSPLMVVENKKEAAMAAVSQRVTVKRKRPIHPLEDANKKEAAMAAVHARLEKEPWIEPSKNVTIKVKRGNRRRRAPTSPLMVVENKKEAAMAAVKDLPALVFGHNDGTSGTVKRKRAPAPRRTKHPIPPLEDANKKEAAMAAVKTLVEMVPWNPDPPPRNTRRKRPPPIKSAMAKGVGKIEAEAEAEGEAEKEAANEPPEIEEDAPIQNVDAAADAAAAAAAAFEDPSAEFPYLYPSLDDPEFNLKIAQRQAFWETQYDGSVVGVQAKADALCASEEFDLLPHQQFVKNFMSVETPYNGLLMFMGLGTGKTCSAISVAEEMRAYMQKTGLDQQTPLPRILVIAAPNVQDNFRLQLFDPRKLRNEHGVWKMHSCVGEALIQEVLPSNEQGRGVGEGNAATILANIGALIAKYYQFVGYTQFANDAEKHVYGTHQEAKDHADQQIKNIRKHYSHRLIIVDEVHNMRSVEADKKSKRGSDLLMQIVQHAENVRLVFLSATPMYHSPTEIVWFTNILNQNDGRAPIEENQVFDRRGDLTPEGAQLLRRKLTGYVSYVRGENPYSFPYRIYPAVFDPKATRAQFPVPEVMYTGRPIEEGQALQHTDVYCASFPEQSYQQAMYVKIIEHLRGVDETNDDDASAPQIFGYTTLLVPIQALNMVYPLVGKEAEEAADDKQLVGDKGLEATMQYQTQEISRYVELKYDFEYKKKTLETVGRIFAPEVIDKYSVKIANIGRAIRRAQGIVMVYSNFIAGGLVPMALALEEMGFERLATAADDTPPDKHHQNLFKTRPEGAPRNQGCYIMITGDKSYSKNNDGELAAANRVDNADGSRVKIILISKNGAEGLDYKNVRQIHLLDPWYNMSRIEQIIGRGVRNKSHCDLPFEDRNVEIYMHATVMTREGGGDPSQECVDMTMYRMSEKKAVQIGQVTRLLKEISVDCLLHRRQHDFTVENMNTVPENRTIQLRLSSGQTVDRFEVGDRPFTAVCDYQERCELQCSPKAETNMDDHHRQDPVYPFLDAQRLRIVERLRQLFQDKHYYTRAELLRAMKASSTTYPLEHIYSALTYLVGNKQEPLVDDAGHTGYLTNRGEVYAFQPFEIDDPNLSILERSMPVDYKRETLALGSLLPPAAAAAAPAVVDVAAPVDDDDPKAAAVGIVTSKQLMQQLNSTLDAVLSPNPWPFGNQEEGRNKPWAAYVHKIRPFLQTVFNLVGLPSTTEAMANLVTMHEFETMSLPHRQTLLQGWHGGKGGDEWGTTPSHMALTAYFEKHSLRIDPQRYVPLANDASPPKVVFYTEDPATREWKPSHRRSLVLDPIDVVGKKQQGIGFLGFIHDGQFKIKLLENTRKGAIGATVKDKKGSEIIKYMEDMVMRQHRAVNVGELMREAKLEKMGLVVFLECMMRAYGDTFFCTPEQAIGTFQTVSSNP